MNETKLILELQAGWYFGPGYGTPPRTNRKDDAKRFTTMEEGRLALQEAREYGLEFRFARFIQVDK